MTAVTPERYASDLRLDLGLDAHGKLIDSREESILWAASGAQYLTGEADKPPQAAPAPLATCAQGAWLALADLSEGKLDPSFPAYKLLGERAAIYELKRQGNVSPGGGCHVLDCADGQLALNLSREGDWELLPAWLEQQSDSWDDIARTLISRPCESMANRARLLGLAAAVSRPPAPCTSWFKSMRLAPGKKYPLRPPLVVDLSALWAGPLCTALLGDMGARVIKVESTLRPDGARSGPAQFFDLLNGHKQSVALDLNDTRGRDQLCKLLTCADIIVESSRPRALEQMGIQASDIVRQGNGSVWLSITGYGRGAPMREWIAYGDDAGVAAGLSWLLRQSSGANTICSDAIADPLTGLHAALLAWTAWLQGGGVLLDLSLSSVLTRCIATRSIHNHSGTIETNVLPPSARSPEVRAVALGKNTSEVLLEFGIRN